MEFMVCISGNVAREPLRAPNRGTALVEPARCPGTVSFESVCQSASERSSRCALAILVHRSHHKAVNGSVVAAGISGIECRSRWRREFQGLYAPVLGRTPDGKI